MRYSVTDISFEQTEIGALDVLWYEAQTRKVLKMIPKNCAEPTGVLIWNKVLSPSTFKSN